MKIIQFGQQKHSRASNNSNGFKKKNQNKQKMNWNDYGEQKISEMIFNTTNVFEKNENRSR